MSIPLPKVAARTAYYAAFHAAEAFIVERSGKVAKTHSGVRSEFARLLKSLPASEASLLKLLGQAYKFKEAADYGLGAGAVVTDEEAYELIGHTTQFIERVATLLSASEL